MQRRAAVLLAFLGTCTPRPTPPPAGAAGVHLRVALSATDTAGSSARGVYGTVQTLPMQAGFSGGHTVPQLPQLVGSVAGTKKTA